MHIASEHVRQQQGNTTKGGQTKSSYQSAGPSLSGTITPMAMAWVFQYALCAL
jgi:hypothetical protein